MVKTALLLFLLFSYCTADLPSCARAKCVHCAVDFIGRMCPTACAGCNTNQVSSLVQQPQQQYQQPQQQHFQQSVNARQVSNEGGQYQQQYQQPQQQLQQQQQPSVNIPVQFAAPVYQGNQNPIPYPQQVQTATLAPLIETPKINTFDPNLSRQPADLAQPLPEYQNGQSFLQQPQQQYQYQQPQQQQFGQFNMFQQQPNPFQLPAATQSQQQNPLLNPFQGFLQQPGQPNAFDPFNLFNLNQQGLPTVQTQQPQQPQQQYGQVQHQGNYNQQYQQYQQPQYQQYQQPAPVQQPQQPLPTPPPVAAARSVDTRPVNFEKYVDVGKGTPLGTPPPVPQQPQCPRQPGWQPCITKDTANERFRNCCSRLGEGCAPLCNYDATLATMQLAVLTGRCPLAKVGDVMICASGYQDASQCCEAYGVFEPGYEHCRPYCNPSAGLPEGGLLTEKYKCLVKLGHIQQCFFVSQKP